MKTEPDEAAEIEGAVRAALHRLAPLGGERRLHVNAAAGALIAILAELLAGTPEASAEVERLTALFRERLEAALSRSTGGEARH